MDKLGDDFGVIVACHRGDYPLALGCLASVRRFMPEVPLALIVDGEFPLNGLEEFAGLRVIRRGDVRDAFLREKSFGWGLTKMVAFWESPWRRFLYVDADTVMWGDLRVIIAGEQADLVLDRPRHAYAPAQIAEYFFEPVQLAKHFPGFAWRDRSYANSGAFVAARGALALREYEAVLRVALEHPGIFKCGEQGILNFLAFHAADAGRLRLAQLPLQILVPDVPAAELRQRFRFERAQPAVAAGTAEIIHWCGQKPWLVDGARYHEPMTHFRRETNSSARLWIRDLIAAARRNRWVKGVARRMAARSG